MNATGANLRAHQTRSLRGGGQQKQADAIACFRL